MHTEAHRSSSPGNHVKHVNHGGYSEGSGDHATPAESQSQQTASRVCRGWWLWWLWLSVRERCRPRLRDNEDRCPSGFDAPALSPCAGACVRGCCCCGHQRNAPCVRCLSRHHPATCSGVRRDHCLQRRALSASRPATRAADQHVHTPHAEATVQMPCQWPG